MKDSQIPMQAFGEDNFMSFRLKSLNQILHSDECPSFDARLTLVKTDKN